MILPLLFGSETAQQRDLVDPLLGRWNMVLQVHKRSDQLVLTTSNWKARVCDQIRCPRCSALILSRKPVDQICPWYPPNLDAYLVNISVAYSQATPRALGQVSSTFIELCTFGCSPGI